MTGERNIVLAPFANERMREWPVGNYHRFTARGLRDGWCFNVLGAIQQRPLADEFVRPYPADRVRNLCGSISWIEAEEVIGTAACVVTNNSGLAHLAASRGVPLLCVFGAKHSWVEWMPRGPRVTTIVRPPACSPCDSSYCPNDLACLAGISGDLAYDEMLRSLALPDTRPLS